MVEPIWNSPYRGKFVLLTGVPGIGKSLLRGKLLEKYDGLEVIEFGDIVHQLTSAVEDVSRENLRAAPDKKISLSILGQASLVLAEEVESRRRKADVVVIAHSTAKTDFGFYVIPELRDVENSDLDAVVVLHGSPEDIERRLAVRDSGKSKMTMAQLETSQQILDSCAVSVSQRADCPMYIVDVNEDVVVTLKGINRVFEHIGMRCSLK